MKKAFLTTLLFSFLVGATAISSMASTNHGMMGQQGMDMNQRPCMTSSAPGSMPQMMGPGMMEHGMMGPGMMDPGMMDHGMMGAGMMRMGMMDGPMAHSFYLDRADELGLSADQVAKLKALQSDSRRDNIRNVAEVKIARMELADLLDDKDWSLNDAEPLIRKVQKLEGDVQVRYLQAMSGARKVLTAEQLKQASSDAYGNAGKMESLFK